MPIYRGEGGSGESSTNALVNEVAQDAADAANSANEAAASATSAANSAIAAAASETAAETAETNAETAETNAASSATAAASSATSAASSATTATTQASAASTSATNAATSETNAATSATNAATSETNAATSATNAATSETNASNSASAASTSATNAATSETNAATSETNAATSATNAATSATNAAASYDDFDDRYLGAKSSDPSVDNDGDALLTGALYFNTTSNVMKVYTGSAWNEINDTLDSLTDVTITSASNGQVLKYNGSVWINDTDAGGIGLTDLSVTTNAAGTAALSYNNTNGVFSYTPPDLSGYLTSFTETNDLTAAVTWANVPDANITQSSVTQHQAALSITESQISDLGTYLTAESDTLDSVTGRGATTTNAITVGNLTSTGIDDNATSNAVTIDSSQNVILSGSYLEISNGGRLQVSGAQPQNADLTGGSTNGTDSDGLFAFYGGRAYNTGAGIVLNGADHANLPNVTRFVNGAFTERMRIDADGNVGIGETSPQAKLDVSTSATTAQATYNGQIKTGVYSTDGNLDSGIEWQVRGDGSGYGFRAINIHAGGGNQWRLQSRDNSATWTDNITVDGGNVGIGQSTPFAGSSGSDYTTVHIGDGASAPTQSRLLLEGSVNTYGIFTNTNRFGIYDYTADAERLTVTVSGTVRFHHGIEEKQYNLTGTVIDPDNGTIQYKTLVTATTFTESLDNGEFVTLMINDGNANTVTWPTITWIGGSAPVLQTSGYNVIELWQVNGTLYGAFVGAT